MFKLTAVLCAAMFVVLLIGGEDRGQLRPGLANAPAVAAVDVVAPESQPEVAPLAASDAAPAEVAPVSAPVTVATDRPDAPAVETGEPVFSLATFAPEATAPATATADAAASDSALAYVTAGSVNVREGPGTQNPVLTRLTRGEAVTIVSTDDAGWARIRLEGDGLEGFMSMEYLSATAP
jgi:hypothetical protein